MELVTDRSQGVQLATIQALSSSWTTKYDWRAFEARLNALPQFRTRIDGVDIHFIHVRSRNKGALPLIMTHGRPGSIVELLQAIDPLTNPPRTGPRPGLVRPGAPVHTRLRLLRPADRDRMGPRSHRERLGGADAPSATPATSPRAATSGPPSPTSSAAKHPRV